MGLHNTDTVDYLGLEKGTGHVVATLVDDLEWCDEVRHIGLLQAKLNRYFDFIDSGEIFEMVSQAVGRSIPVSTPVRISILARHEPLGEGVRFLEHVSTVARDAGVDFAFKVLNHEP